MLGGTSSTPHEGNSPFLFTLAFRPNDARPNSNMKKKKQTDKQRYPNRQSEIPWTFKMAFKIIAVNTFWE